MEIIRDHHPKCMALSIGKDGTKNHSKPASVILVLKTKSEIVEAFLDGKSYVRAPTLVPCENHLQNYLNGNWKVL
jgi:hypothetical protein